jgi:tetratricopeptide (TPR) repeat protein
MLRIGRRTRIVGVLIVAISCLATGLWAWEWAATRDARQVRQAIVGGRLAAVEAPIRRWVKARPDSPEAHLLKGRFELARDNINGAFEGLKRARSLGGHQPELDLLQALIAAKHGRPMEAEPVLRQAFEAASAPDPQLDEALARVYLETFDLVRATAVLDRWAREAPDDPRPHLWRAEIDSRRESAPDAVLNDYREALKRDPRLERARLGMADELRKAHGNAEAATEYDKYLSLKPNDLAAHLGAGQNLLEMGEDEAATRHLEQVLTLDPKNALALKQFAEADLNRGDFAAALAHLDRAIKIDPYDLPVRHRRRLTLAWLERNDEAKAEERELKRLRTELDLLNEARARLAVSPDDHRAQIEIARWMIEHGQEGEGVRWSEHVLRTHPGDPEANRLLADFHQRRGDAGLANFYRLNASSSSTSPPESSGSTTDQGR